MGKCDCIDSLVFSLVACKAKHENKICIAL